MYQGHHSDGSSIQRHSVGSGYPFIFQVREDVPNGTGHAEVIDSMQNVLYRATYPLGDKPARIAAYGRALEAQDNFAEAVRLGVVRP